MTHEEPESETTSTASKPTKSGSKKRLFIGIGVIILSIIIFIASSFLPSGIDIPTVNPGSPSPQNNNKLVHLTGDVSSKEFTDPMFQITAAGTSLERIVEMYQWVEENGEYKKEWKNELIALSGDKVEQNGYKNPPEMPFFSEKWTVEEVKIGGFSLAPSLAKKVSIPKELTLDNSDFSKLNSDGQKAFKLHNGKYFFGLSPNTPRIGDLRVGFKTSPAGTVSILAKQQGGMLTAYRSENGVIEKAFPGTRNAETMSANIDLGGSPIIPWIVRAIGLIILVAGVLIIVMKGSKKESDDQPEHAEMPDKPKEPETEEQDEIQQDEMVIEQPQENQDTAASEPREKFTKMSGQSSPVPTPAIDDIDENEDFNPSINENFTPPTTDIDDVQTDVPPMSIEPEETSDEPATPSLPTPLEMDAPDAPTSDLEPPAPQKNSEQTAPEPDLEPPSMDDFAPTPPALDLETPTPEQPATDEEEFQPELTMEDDDDIEMPEGIEIVTPQTAVTSEQEEMPTPEETSPAADTPEFEIPEFEVQETETESEDEASAPPTGTPEFEEQETEASSEDQLSEPSIPSFEPVEDDEDEDIFGSDLLPEFEAPLPETEETTDSPETLEESDLNELDTPEFDIEPEFDEEIAIEEQAPSAPEPEIEEPAIEAPTLPEPLEFEAGGNVAPEPEEAVADQIAEEENLTIEEILAPIGANIEDNGNEDSDEEYDDDQYYEEDDGYDDDGNIEESSAMPALPPLPPLPATSETNAPVAPPPPAPDFTPPPAPEPAAPAPEASNDLSFDLPGIPEDFDPNAEMEAPVAPEGDDSGDDFFSDDNAEHSPFDVDNK
jgi:hypothetical protein